MARDAEMTAGDYLSLVINGIAAETDIGVTQANLMRAAQAITQYGSPALLAERQQRLAAKAKELMNAAVPGSDHQFAFAHTYIANATQSTDTDFLKALLTGSATVPGLAIDIEMRWTLLTRLVVLGLAGDSEINAEADNDRTASGEKHAATTRAARPTAAAKAEAWEAVVESTSLSNHVAAATMQGFWVHEQKDITQPYIAKYFAMLEQLWEQRPGEPAESITLSLFPAGFISEETLAMTDEYLASAQDIAGPCKRTLVEQRDFMARALRARAADIAATR